MNSFTLDEIYVGQKASVTKTITRGDIYAFAGLVDDYSPVHIDKAFGEQSPFGRCIAHGFLSGAVQHPGGQLPARRRQPLCAPEPELSQAGLRGGHHHRHL